MAIWKTQKQEEKKNKTYLLQLFEWHGKKAIKRN